MTSTRNRQVSPNAMMVPDQPGGDVNSGRHRTSMSIAGAIANMSSIAAMGAGIADGILQHSAPEHKRSHKASSRNSLPEISSSDLTSVSGGGGGQRRRRGTSFLHLNIPEHTGWTAGMMGSHLHLPTFSLTPAVEGASAVSSKKFSFSMGLRRLSQTALNRSDSMVSLCFRSLASYISDDNLVGLQHFLENKRVQVDDHDENGVTALIVAATKGKLPFVTELINHGADVNAEDGDNWSALLCAAKEGYADICLELLDHGADIEHRDMGGWTALMWASYKGRTEVVSLLLERGAEANAHGNFHISSLLWAAGRGHVEIVKDLVHHGAKVNMGDKYGTSALVWACRKGNPEIVEVLLKAGANVDTAGMYSWTALLVATLGNHVDVVSQLLAHKPNVNALDKDGCTALTIACKEGYHEIAIALLNVGAYINIQDRAMDTNLIHAVKGGHRCVVEQLLKKYADVDIYGKDRKTAIYWAVEKGNYGMVKLLLSANPDLEICTKDGDTPLLRAVRIRNADIVQLLLDKKAKVGAADKKGDTALHIAMRARSKGIVEVLLRNPKNSQLLYRPNRAGETPYNIDINHQKTILGQIFGARRLNTNEDNENMLGYDLYSSALADILSEPSLSMPITVGLYAKWGSGKSFLLDKLRDEMKSFARQWVDPVFQFTFMMFMIVLHIAVIVGTVIGLATQSWIIGLSCGGGVVFLVYTFLIIVWWGSQKYDWYWPYNFTMALTRKLNYVRLVLQVTFCHPPGTQGSDGMSVQPIMFYFTDQARVSSTTGGENTVVQMLGSLYDSIENDYGSFATRLYRAFRPKSSKTTTTWRWRRLCCLPYILIFELGFLCFILGCCILTIYLVNLQNYASNTPTTIDQMTAQVILVTLGLALGVGLLSNLYTWGQMLQALFFSQRRHLQRTIARLDTLKSEGFLQALRTEVTLMTDMVKCLDSFTTQQTRLVVIVDGLDSCEQDKVLLVLDAVHMLFSGTTSPFIVILAIDPHIISKAVEVNSRRLFSESNIGGHDYLRNMVHLPFFLQNSGLRNVKVAQQTAQHQRKGTSTVWTESEEAHFTASTTGLSTASARRMSSESGLSSTEKLKLPSRKGSRKLKLSESIASSLGSNLNRVGGAQDLTKMLLTDDYFSDVNPRSMRRLMNVVYVTGRLLKAFQIDFNWYHLASWVNITEQWPFRTSWLILHYDTSEDQWDDNTSLKTMYDKIRPQIPSSKEVEPLLELDRDERKFDVFLTFHRSSLLVSDLKVFLPFTINLDPYLKKVIKEDQQNLDDNLLGSPYGPSPGPVSGLNQWAMGVGATNMYPGGKSSFLRRQHSLPGFSERPSTGKAPSNQGDDGLIYPHGSMMGWPQSWMGIPPSYPQRHPITTLPPDVLETRLSTLNVDGVCNLFSKIDDLSLALVTKYTTVIRDNNINGRVLLHCDLEELKVVLKMSFGDWELFRMLIVSLREQELTIVSQQEELNSKNVRFVVPANTQQDRKAGSSKTSSRDEKDKPIRMDRSSSKHSIMEKQVTLEEQMICGALQTLNEEACEDVLDEAEEQEESKVTLDPEWMRGVGSRLRTGSQSSNVAESVAETDVILLQASPLHHPYWQPVVISVGSGECGSASSSLCGTPVAQRKSALAPAKGRSPKQRTRPSSLVVSDEQSHVVIFEHLTPPASPKHHVAFRSHSSEDDVENTRQQTTLTSMRIKKSNSSLSEAVLESVSPSVVVSPTSSMEKLNRLKDRFMRSMGATTSCSMESKGDIDSDDESTPLVSGITTPTVVEHTAITPLFSNRGFAGNSNSSSEHSSLKPSPVSPSPLIPDTNLTFDVKSVASSFGSSISLSNVLEPASNFSNLVVASGSVSSLASQEKVDVKELKVMRKSLSGHFSRQDAVDQAENNNKDASNPETTV